MEHKKMESTSEKRLAPGVWTPWAEVLCWKCHGPDCGIHGRVSARDHYDWQQLRVRESDELEAWCDRCGRKVWVRDDVALCQQAVRALIDEFGDAGLEQTGGMCCAATFTIGGGRCAYVCPDEDYPDGTDRSPMWHVNWCDAHGDFPDDSYDTLGSLKAVLDWARENDLTVEA